MKVVRSEPKTSAPDLANMIDDDYGIKVVPQTITHNATCMQGTISRSARRKPLISKINKQTRIDFAKVYTNKATEFWHSVIFSDECEFNIFGNVRWTGESLEKEECTNGMQPLNTVEGVY